MTLPRVRATWTRLLDRFLPPGLDDPDARRRGRLVVGVSVLTLTGVALFLSGTALGASLPPLYTGTSLLALVAMLASLAAVRRGALETGAWIVTLGPLAAAAVAIVTAGVDSALVGAVCVVLVIATLVLGWKGVGVLGSLAMALALVGPVLHRLDIVDVRPLPWPASWSLGLLSVWTMTLMLVVASRRLTDLLADLRRNERALRQANAALVESQRTLSQLVAESPDGIVILDEQGAVAIANPALARITGLDVGDVVGRRVVPLLGLDAELEARVEAELAALRDGAAPPPREIEILRADGVPCPVEVHARPISHGGRRRVLAIVRDATLRKREETRRRELEEQLRAAQRMESIGRLAGGIAHDFNNLLAIILANATSLAGEPLGPLAREDVASVRTAATRGAELVRQLLAFSRKQVMSPRIFSLREVVTELERMLRRLLPETIQLAFDPGTTPGWVKADPSQIEQVVVNLVVNARDAMPAGGALRLALAEGAGADGAATIVLTVSDTGTGMDEDTLDRIFEPFFTTKPMGKGTGLGLATVHGIVSQSGGQVVVRSQLGQGSTFEVHLPRVEPAQA
jgi:PAS domain S-box-containing protein